MESIGVFYKGRRIKIKLKKTNFLTQFTGLMFRTRKTNNLLFEFNKSEIVSFTSLFVFFPFVIVWLDDKNRVLGTRVVKPFELVVKPGFSFKKAVEIPINNGNRNLIKIFRREKAKI